MKKYSKLIGVSGGPDSMLLLHKYKSKNIIVAHVNYHYRGDESNEDQRLVVNYCKKNNLLYKVLDLNEELNQKYLHIKNKQARARQIRFDFFYKIANEYDIKNIYIAHNKDDFIETAMLQERRDKHNRKLFFGIQKNQKKSSKIYVKDFKIKRPLLMYWKDQILLINKRKSIPFRFDQSNSSLKYERNKIRSILSKNYTTSQKQEIYQSYYNKNKFLRPERKRIEKLFKNWKKTEFSISLFLKNEISDKQYLIYLFVNENNEQTNLTFDKINSIINFVDSKNNNNKKYVLSNLSYISKKIKN